MKRSKGSPNKTGSKFASHYRYEEYRSLSDSLDLVNNQAPLEQKLAGAVAPIINRCFLYILLQIFQKAKKSQILLNYSKTLELILCSQAGRGSHQLNPMRTKLDLDKKTWDEIFEWHKKFQEEKKTKQIPEKKTGNEGKKNSTRDKNAEQTE